MTVEEAVSFSEFLHESTLLLSQQPRDVHGTLVRKEDRALAKTLYNLVDEHEKTCRRLLSHD